MEIIIYKPEMDKQLNSLSSNKIQNGEGLKKGEKIDKQSGKLMITGICKDKGGN